MEEKIVSGLSRLQAEEAVQMRARTASNASTKVAEKLAGNVRPETKVFASIRGRETLAICSFEDFRGIPYLAEFAGFEKGAGRQLIEGVMRSSIPEFWGLAELLYDEKTDTYSPNAKLREYYAGCGLFEVFDVPAAESPWKCETPVFCTKGSKTKALAAFRLAFRAR